MTDGSLFFLFLKSFFLSSVCVRFPIVVRILSSISKMSRLRLGDWGQRHHMRHAPPPSRFGACPSPPVAACMFLSRRAAISFPCGQTQVDGCVGLFPQPVPLFPLHTRLCVELVAFIPSQMGCFVHCACICMYLDARVCRRETHSIQKVTMRSRGDDANTLRLSEHTQGGDPCDSLAGGGAGRGASITVFLWALRNKRSQFWGSADVGQTLAVCL